MPRVRTIVLLLGLAAAAPHTRAWSAQPRPAPQEEQQGDEAILRDVEVVQELEMLQLLEMLEQMELLKAMDPAAPPPPRREEQTP